MRGVNMGNVDYAWIQISDLHIFDNTEWSTLKESYRRLPYLKDICFIIITGDLHQYKGTYEKTKIFLNNLLDLFNLTKKDIFIVPGNHDAGDCSSKEAITHFIDHEVDKDQDCYRDYFVKGKLVDCFEDYNQFIESFYGSYAKMMYPNPEQVTNIIWNNKINIIHLNTAINCNGNNERKQILDIYKLSNIPMKLNKKYPVIMIGHHPFDNLHDSHKNTLRRNITDWKVSAYLCGDLHKKTYYPIMTYSNSGSNIPCIVCGKSAPENLDTYSDLGCIIYIKEKQKDIVDVIPFVWNKDKKCFDPFLGFNNDKGNLKFDLINPGEITEIHAKKERRSEVLVKGESIWLPDAEDAKGKQARFGTFTETKIIDEFIQPDSNFWGLSAVKGIGKTFVLQIKRSRISRKNKLCLPIGIKPSAKNAWGTDTIHLESKIDLTGLKDFDNVVVLWRYCIIVYVINQLINIGNKVKDKMEWIIANPEEKLYSRLKDYFHNGFITKETYFLCTYDEYKNLDLVMKGVLSFKNWTNFINKDLSRLVLLQHKIEEMINIFGKESLVIMIDKIDQSIRQTNMEEPLSCNACKKSKKISTCTNPQKSPQYCADRNTFCRIECCYGCETYETPYSNTNLRVYGSGDKKKSHINLWQYIQMGLIDAVARIKAEFNGLIEVYFTIRQEAFSCENTLWGDNSKKVTRLIQELWYTKEEQKEIFYDCIRHQQDEYLFDPLIVDQPGRVEEAFVGVSQLCHPYAKELTETVFESIYRHSFDRTRDIQEYGQMLTEKMDEIRKCDTILERGEKVKEFIEMKAAELAFDDRTENAAKNASYYVEKMNLLSNYWADSDNFKRFIMMFDKNLLFGREARGICKKFNRLSKCSGNCSECLAEHHPFSMLYKLGMLGQIKTYHKWKNDILQQFNHSKGVTYILGTQLINLNEDTIYVLHPALTKSIERLNKKVRHFSGFIIGKELAVKQDKLKQLESDYNKMKIKDFDAKYFYDKK